MPKVKPNKFSWQDRRMSFVYALRGIRHVIRTQHNAWLHVVATAAVLLLGFSLSISGIEWCCLIVCLTVVWTAEAFNTALESLTDLITPEFHPLAGIAKDVAAGAVLIAAVGTAMVGALVFVPHVWLLLNR
jgi:diacylglycerol kinase